MTEYRSKYTGAEIDARLGRVEEISDLSNRVGKLENKEGLQEFMTNVTWSELVSLRDNGELVAGRLYRITDYVTTTTQENTQSAGHRFDIIVLALDGHTLAEEAWAIYSMEDYYFADHGANLSAWKIWYSLDNNRERFAWADEDNGKGVIYRMIDEWGNDCPYDFKNIQFKRGLYADGRGIAKEEGDEDYEAFCYTFSWEEGYEIIMDASIFGNNGYLLNDEEQIIGVYGNTIKSYITYTGEFESPSIAQQHLNNIVFLGTFGFEGGVFYGCYDNSFGNSCYDNSFGNSCYGNSFGRGCSNNSFGNSCYNNSIGNECYRNSFGNECADNSFGNGCSNNSFGNSCGSNSFGSGGADNSFGNSCGSNSFGNDCGNNSFGNGCYFNSFGNGCSNNSFGNSCGSNSFVDSEGLAHDFSYNRFDNGVHEVRAWIDQLPEDYGEVRFNHVCSGVSNIDYLEFYGDATYGLTYTINSDGEVRRLVLGDLA